MSEHNSELLAVGGRIKALRQKKGLTQSALAGGDITRNMLSRIENGAALPSLPTLCAIASRLGVPAGVLLGDSGDYADWQLSRELRRLTGERKYDEVIELCRQAYAVGGEISEMLCKAYIERARELYDSGKLSAALQYLEAAKAACENSENELIREALSRNIFLIHTLITECPAIYSSEEKSIDEWHIERLKQLIFDKNELAIYLYCLTKLRDLPHGAYSQPHELAGVLRGELGALISGMKHGLLRIHIDAKLDMLSAEYLDAKAKLLPMLGMSPSPALLYEVLADLEFCCKCCGDFENAYKYSGQRLELAKLIN